MTISLQHALQAALMNACEVPEVGDDVSAQFFLRLWWAYERKIGAGETDLPLWVLGAGAGNGAGLGYGDGCLDGSGIGSGYGFGHGSGYGSADGYGSGYADGSGDGSGYGVDPGGTDGVGQSYEAAFAQLGIIPATEHFGRL